jgi:hypothetical protein
MDIVTKIKPLKATYESLSPAYKLAAALVLASLASMVFPHGAYAGEAKPQPQARLVFEAGDHTQYLSELENAASLQYRHEAAVQKLRQQLRLAAGLEDYLKARRSPLADYAETIIQQNNWKKIVALANAESSLCKKYIEKTANCWGVGGSNLWDLGDDLGEGVAAMNRFLNTAPSKSPIKYAQMNFDQMNGLYKQPAREHWVYNNLIVYNDLTALEKTLK